MACSVVGAAYVLAVGPFQRASAAPVHGPISYDEAASLATDLGASQGGGPWTVWAGAAVQIQHPYDLSLVSLYDWPPFSCSSDPSTYAGVHSSMMLPASPETSPTGYFSVWFVQLGNASGWVRTVLVLNGTPTIALQEGPTHGCTPGAWLPSADQLGLVLDSPRVLTSAWNGGGSQFVSQNPNANLSIESSFLGSDTTWYWVVVWSTCPFFIGGHVASGMGELQTVDVNALNGTADRETTQTVAC